MSCSCKKCLMATHYTLGSIYLLFGILFVINGSMSVVDQASWNYLVIPSSPNSTFSSQFVFKDIISDHNDLTDLPKSSTNHYIAHSINLVIGIVAALTGSLGIVGAFKRSKRILCTSASLYAIIFMTSAASLIYFCLQEYYHVNGSGVDPAMKRETASSLAIFSSAWIITSIAGATLSVEIGGVPCHCNAQQDSSQDFS